MVDGFFTTGQEKFANSNPILNRTNRLELAGTLL
jgi:hypothetical protein